MSTSNALPGHAGPAGPLAVRLPSAYGSAFAISPPLLCRSSCAACATQGGAASPKYYLHLSADPASLDPALSTDVQSGEVVTLLFDNLVQFDPDAQLQPGLATRWESDPPGAGYTFHLRSGATFHDGRPIGARRRARLDPARAGARAPGRRGSGRCSPSGARATYAAGKAKDGRGHRGAATTPPSCSR